MKRSDFRYKIDVGGVHEPHYEISIWFYDEIIYDKAMSFVPVKDSDVEDTIERLIENPTDKMIEIRKRLRENKLERINK